MSEPSPVPNRSSRAALGIWAIKSAHHGLTLWAAMGFTVAMGWLVPGTALGDVQLPFGMRLCLLAGEVCALAAGVAAVAAVLGLIAGTTPARAGRLGKAARAACGFLVAGGALFCYVGSWTLFWATGRFFDSSSLEFLLTNGWMAVDLAREMNPYLIAGVPLASLLGAGLALALAPRLRTALPDRTRRILALATLGLVGISALAFLLGQGIHHRMLWIVESQPSSVRCPAATWYEYRRDQSAGPLLHLAASLVRAEGRGSSVGGTAELLRRPQIPLDKYVKGVDPKTARPWNVVHLMIDSLRPDQLMAYGGDREVMPRLEALARESTLFLDARTESSHTDYALPSPLSSHHPLRSTRVHRYPKNPPYPRVFLYDILKAVGYRTALFTSHDGHWGQMLNYLETGGLDHVFHAGGAVGAWNSGKTNDDAVTVREAIRWIRGAGRTPFFLHLSLQNPHLPYSVPEGWPRKFGAPQDFVMTFGHFPPDRARDVKNLYADALRYADDQLGLLFDDLRAQGLWDNTLIVVMADHGEAFYEHDVAAHASKIYDEVMRVPLILRAPGAPARTDSRPAELLDVPPTILELLGLPPHPSFQGLSLAGPRPAAPRSRYMLVQSPLATQYGIERDGWKLICDDEVRVQSLYDLRADPSERNDLALTRPEVLQDLLWRLSAWKAAQLDYYRSPGRMASEYPPIIVDR
jgi:arylsulfatase A-like enzyme